MNNPLHIRTIQRETCPICGERDFHPVLQGQDFESHTGRYAIEYCSQCTGYFTNPQPIQEDIPKLYQWRDTADFMPPHRFGEYLRGLSIQWALKRLLPRNDTNLAVLDFGCGDGFFALQVMRYLKQAHVTAVDFHPTPPYYLQTQPLIQYETYDTYQQRAILYDVIVCRHVLEHHPFPGACLKDLNNRLKSGGILILEVPNFQSIWRKIWGQYYFGLYLPRHMVHFTKECLITVLQGFETVTILNADTPLLGKSLGNLLQVDIENTGFMGLLSFPLQMLFDRITGESSTLQVIAVKKS